MPNLIPYQIILAAKAGSLDAMTTILLHCAPYISTFLKCKIYDDYGNQHYLIDEDIRQRIEAKLMCQIILKFNPSKQFPWRTSWNISFKLH